MLLVGVKGERRFTRFEQLSGRTVALTTGSAAGASVNLINQKLALRKLPPVKIEWVDPTGGGRRAGDGSGRDFFHLTIVEQPIAERWATLMPKLRLTARCWSVHPMRCIGIMRRDASMLRASIDRFLAGYKAPADQDVAFERVYRRLYRVHYPLARADRQKLEKLRPVLQKHARQQGMDWLNPGSAGLQESTLDPRRQGSGGATGLLQITPSAAQRVGVSNIPERG